VRIALSNKRMQLTKRGLLFVGAPSRASIIKSRFAADPWCWTDVRNADHGRPRVVFARDRRRRGQWRGEPALRTVVRARRPSVVAFRGGSGSVLEQQYLREAGAVDRPSAPSMSVTTAAAALPAMLEPRPRVARDRVA
jgi:hypothetical protein